MFHFFSLRVKSISNSTSHWIHWNLTSKYLEVPLNRIKWLLVTTWPPFLESVVWVGDSVRVRRFTISETFVKGYAQAGNQKKSKLKFSVYLDFVKSLWFNFVLLPDYQVLMLKNKGWCSNHFLWFWSNTCQICTNHRKNIETLRSEIVK